MMNSVADEELTYISRGGRRHLRRCRDATDLETEQGSAEEEDPMVRYAPGADMWGEPLVTLRRIQDEINRAFGDQRWAPAAEFPPVNVWRGPEGVIITAEIPGVKLDAVDVTVHQNTLTLKGSRSPEAPDGETGWHRRERSYGPFSRVIELPFAVDADGVKASVHNGVLSIELPRPESDKPRKITITAKS